MADPSTTRASGSSGENVLAPSGFDELVFQQELYEVYLLLDYISGHPDRQLTALDHRIDNPAKPGDTLSSAEVIERVSMIRYPPSPSQPERAKEAAFLLVLKDILNSIAYPARGMTIAYTTLFSGPRKTTRTDQGSERPTSRSQAAQLAFPALVQEAISFRRLKDLLSWIGLVTTVLAALFLWQVTYGIQLTTRFDEAKANDSQSAGKLYDLLDKERGQKQRSWHDLNAVCSIGQSAPKDSDNSDVSTSDASSTVQPLCNVYAYRHAVFCVAISDIGTYSRSLMFIISRHLLPIHKIDQERRCDGDTTAHAIGRQEDAPSIAGVLAMMSNYLLPILFGFAGTIAALVRSIQDKVMDSVLSPRDQALTLIRLPLGMVAGVCVSLFLNPTSVAAQTGSIGTFTVSASGIAFLAGYGSEGFFRALDALIVRVFSAQSPDRPRSPSTN